MMSDRTEGVRPDLGARVREHEEMLRMKQAIEDALIACSKSRGVPWCCRDGCWWSANTPSPYPSDQGKAWDQSRICPRHLAEYDAEVEVTREWLRVERTAERLGIPVALVPTAAALAPSSPVGPHPTPSALPESQQEER